MDSSEKHTYRILVKQGDKFRAIAAMQRGMPIWAASTIEEARLRDVTKEQLIRERKRVTRKYPGHRFSYRRVER